jgi:integrase
MFNYSLNGVTATSVRDVRKKSHTDKCPIRVRVTYKRKQVYYSTGISLDDLQWAKVSDQKTKSKAELKIREDIYVVFDITKKHIETLIKDDNFSFENLNYRLGHAGADTVNAAFKTKIEKLFANNKIGTSEWYKYALRGATLFAGGNIQFAQVTVDWLKKYEKYLLDEGKSYTTISMYMRALQVIMNDAKTIGLVKAANHPFGKGKYEIPQHEGRKMALTLPQIGQLVKYECPTETIEMCRDIWFFSYLCNGANVTDICKLKYSNISNGEIGFYRQKTIAKSKIKKQVRAVITPEMQQIIQRWGNNRISPDTFIFPFLRGNESAIDERRIIKNFTHLLNDNIQKIGRKLGIENISTYTARHSFATVLKRSGVNIAYISESLGHNDIKTTENYLDQFETEERQKNAAALTNF